MAETDNNKPNVDEVVVPDDLEVFVFHHTFDQITVRYSIDCLNDNKRVTDSAQILWNVALTHPKQSASAFWTDLLAVIGTTQTQTLFVVEE
ncbi:hypothetical protein SEPCBS119000_006649, partial [Sporothrix epigloea]